MDYVALLGARIVDEIVPTLDEPAGLAVDIADEDGAMFFRRSPALSRTASRSTPARRRRGAAVSGDGSDLAFDQTSVAKFTQGVGATIDQLGELGGATGSVMGKGFSGLAMTGMEAGHRGLSVDFEDFCERWEWGVRALASDASALADRLGLAAGTQWKHDQYVEGSFKVGISAAMGGNPHASEEDISQQGWGDILTPDYLDPDWSAESFEKAGQDVEQTWKDTGRTVLTEGQGGRESERLKTELGLSDGQWDRALDDTFGPSPEERAQQAQQQGDTNTGGGG